ncbi:MAG: response regulator [Synergistaceae bacterium]|jgi:two-component system response regulator DctR|uniref:response regulator n=1 Tax=Aminivibrio sp. TaxID=1872489 RepID=UPI0031CD51ED|nr:response regulator [Synergistaceae bacterium]MDD4020650.1 response regulator [Synergistaceae bacterium]NCC61734.1 response regulator [Verrucomicrobiae bacterium]
MKHIDVLVVEDDPMVAEIHQNFINSVDNFRVAGLVDNGFKALAFLERCPVRLVILDIFLPGLDGMAILEKIRESGENVDVIVVSASRDISTVNRAIQAGAFDYIVKPFVFERIRASLQSFSRMLEQLKEGPKQIDQEGIDTLFSVRSSKIIDGKLPKGLNPNILERLITLLSQKGAPLSSVEAAGELNVSRITARRYLEHLVASGKAVMEQEYHEIGRPVNKYVLLDRPRS